ncbi:MAG: hypothetical protein JWM89_498 [Acidimicrobiales bacterium]|nr:hypothetical protein [Acidimicrobiales bacterium]
MDARRAPATPTDRALDDVVVNDIVGIRLVDATAEDRAAVERQFGPSSAALASPDITIRYVDRLPLDGARLLGPEAAFTDDAFLLLRGRHKRAVRAAVPLDTVGGRCEIVCEHGVGRVPLLVAIVNLTVLAKGGVALHASAFERDGVGILATGWSKGGKTEALLVSLSRGARYVGDEWVHLYGTGRMGGIREPMRVWDWHLASQPALRNRVRRRDRWRMGALRQLARAGSFGGRAGRRAADLADRHRFVDLPPEGVAGRPIDPASASIDRLLLMTSTTSGPVRARPITGAEVADRMAGSLALEREPLLAAYRAFRYAFPNRPNTLIEMADDLERRCLHRFLDDVEAFEILHPRPVDLEILGDAIDGLDPRRLP